MKILKLIILLIVYIKFSQSKTILNDIDIFFQLDVDDVKFAQTHVIPIQGSKWTLNNNDYILKLIPNRESLLMAKFDDVNGKYKVNVWNGDEFVGSLDMNLPKDLPPTEDNGPKYSTEHHNVLIPKNMIKHQMKIQFEDDIGIKSETFEPLIGQEREMLLWTFPIYLFGANDSNSVPFENVKSVDQDVVDELIQKWSVTTLESDNHPLGKIDWPYLVLPPRNNKPSIKITNSDQKRDGYEIMNIVLPILTLLRKVMGEQSSQNQIYSPLIHLNRNGKYADPYGGLGRIGGSVGVGDYSYKGIFIHEQGHTFGLNHAEWAYDNKQYPYIKGSLKGSEWGYDVNHNQFLSIYVPPSAEYYNGCKNSFVLSDDGKYCIKQSVMQGGAGDQSSEYRFSMFADFEMTVIQKYFENALYYNKTTNKYSKFNTTSNEYYQYTPMTKEKGLWSVNENTPIERDVQVYTIIFTHSTANGSSSELSQFYPVLKSTSNNGNLIQYFDPTNATDIAQVIPNTGAIPWYCHNSGCDYTIRITFKDGTQKHIMMDRGNRVYWSPVNDNFKPNLRDPLNEASFILDGVNIRADKELSKLELLDTPKAWMGYDKNSVKILISKDL